VLPSVVPLVRVESPSTAGSGDDGGGGIGGLLDGMERRSGRAGDGGGDINEQSWLRSASGSRGCLGLGEEEGGVYDGLGHGYGRGCGTLAGRDGLRPRSDPLESLGGGWRATFAGRRAALAWEQRRREEVGGNLSLGHVGTNAVEDPAGLGGVESVMRELVLGRGIGDEAREAHTR
jgi:hypothetical protein